MDLSLGKTFKKIEGTKPMGMDAVFSIATIPQFYYPWTVDEKAAFSILQSTSLEQEAWKNN